jgi:tetratricopeptide (TPR) repeat protein
MLLAAALTTSAHLQGPADFAHVFHAYRTGDGDSAVAAFARWDSSRVTREARLPKGEDDRWAQASLALFHAEAAQTSSAWRVHQERARTLMEQLLRDLPEGAVELRSFCRDWFLVAPPGDSWPWLIRTFTGDPIVTLAYGKWLEYWMPRVPGAGMQGYRFMVGEPIVTTSHGQFGQEAPEAVATLRRALEQDPKMVEARVRLGRVLWQLDRRDDAEEELQQAVVQARQLEARALAYLASVFLGQVYEEKRLLKDAEVAYRQALTVNPPGQVASLLLGRLLVATGREADGWSTIASTVNDLPSHVDPWTVYFTDQKRGPERAARLLSLRSRLRESKEN